MSLDDLEEAYLKFLAYLINASVSDETILRLTRKDLLENTEKIQENLQKIIEKINEITKKLIPNIFVTVTGILADTMQIFDFLHNINREKLSEDFDKLQEQELKKYQEYQKLCLLEETEFLENLSSPDFELSAIWSFQHCLLLVKKLLNERQREEWIGDLEEFLYKMHKLKCPRWRFHIEILRRTFDLLKGVFTIKLNALPHKRKSSK